MEFKKGDIVKVTDTGYTYNTFLRFLADHCAEIESKVLAGFKYGAKPDYGKEYKVAFTACHPTIPKQKVVVVFDEEHTFMIESSGLEFVEQVRVGDEVVVTDAGECFSAYQQFMLEHKEEMTSDDFWNYGYNKPYFERFKENVDYGFRVVLIAKHSEQDRDVAVIRNGIDTFLFDVRALKKVNKL